MNYTLSGDLNFTLTYLQGGNIVVDIPNNDLISLSCDLSDPNFFNLDNSTDQDEPLRRRLQNIDSEINSTINLSESEQNETVDEFNESESQWNSNEDIYKYLGSYTDIIGNECMVSKESIYLGQTWTYLRTENFQTIKVQTNDMIAFFTIDLNQ